MDNKIVWTTEALELYFQIINYLSQNFSEKEIAAFTQKVEKKFCLSRAIQQCIGHLLNLKNVYRTIISSQVILIYRFKPLKKEIQLLQFWNTPA